MRPNNSRLWRSLPLWRPLLIGALAWSGCGDTTSLPSEAEGSRAPIDGPSDEEDKALSSTAIQHVFVIAMENHDAGQIYGNSSNAPYINKTLIPNYARATNFNDELPSDWSEPHYIWMEAGTRSFSDHTFNNDNDPSSTNSTGNTNHLVTQIKNSTNGRTWRSYQEGLNSSTGSCPVRSSGFYAPKHNPFVFFRDVAGSPPSPTNSYCAAHHRAYSQLAADLAANDVASFTFITPNLCHDMHGASGCSDSNAIRAGDTWLSTELPRLISYANSHAGIIFLTWDEGDSTLKMPFLAIGPGVKKGFASTASYTHSSLLKTIEQLLGLPVLSTVSSANTFSDMFGTTTTQDLCPSDPNKTDPGQCGCGKREPYDVSGYRDAQGYYCADWQGYDCTQAVEQFGYTQAQETSILANCSLSCAVCPG